MMRSILVFLICVGCLGSSGCQTLTLEHGYTHPHSAVTAPTFCFYEGRDEHSQPIPISEIRVTREEKFSGDSDSSGTIGDRGARGDTLTR